MSQEADQETNLTASLFIAEPIGGADRDEIK